MKNLTIAATGLAIALSMTLATSNQAFARDPCHPKAAYKVYKKVTYKKNYRKYRRSYHHSYEATKSYTKDYKRPNYYSY